MIKKINFVQLKLDLSTNFRIKLRGKFREEKYENEVNEIYHKLVDLRNMYGIVLDYISTEIIELIKVEDLNERERKVISIRKSENKINKEAKEKFGSPNSRRSFQHEAGSRFALLALKFSQTFKS